MRWPAPAEREVRPLSARQVFDAVCGRLVDAVMEDDLAAARVAYAEAAALLPRAFPAVFEGDPS